MDNIIINEQSLAKFNCILRHKEDGELKQEILQTAANCLNAVCNIGTINIIDNQLVWEK